MRIEGPRDGTATIVTRAGYGLYFKHCIDCEIERVTVMGGERDRSGLATDAAIVATRSSVTIMNCVVRDNIGAAETIARSALPAELPPSLDFTWRVYALSGGDVIEASAPGSIRAP